MDAVKKTITNVPFVEGYTFYTALSPSNGTITLIKLWIQFIQANTFELLILNNDVQEHFEEIVGTEDELVYVECIVDIAVGEFDQVKFKLGSINIERYSTELISLYFEVN